MICLLVLRKLVLKGNSVDKIKGHLQENLQLITNPVVKDWILTSPDPRRKESQYAHSYQHNRGHRRYIKARKGVKIMKIYIKLSFLRRYDNLCKKNKRIWNKLLVLSEYSEVKIKKNLNISEHWKIEIKVIYNTRKYVLRGKLDSKCARFLQWKNTTHWWEKLKDLNNGGIDCVHKSKVSILLNCQYSPKRL